MARVILLDILATLFGLGSWISLLGVVIELPLLVQQLPEKWTLPSFVGALCSLANIGPITAYLCLAHIPRTSAKGMIYFVLSLGCASAVLLIFFWKSTTIIFGQERSTGFLGLVFTFALVDCSSRVLFLPFMNRFKKTYIKSFFIGEGLSGFLPSLYVLVQWSGKTQCMPVTLHYNSTTSTQELQPVPIDIRFSVESFFGFLFVMMILCTLAFFLLNVECLVEKGYALAFSTNIENLENTRNSGKYPKIEDKSAEIEAGKKSTEISDSAAKGLLLLTFGSCWIHGSLSSVMTFSCLPYGSYVYLLSTVLSYAASPIVAFIIHFLPVPNKRTIGSSFICYVIVGLYVFWTALASPSPPFVGTRAGEIICIIGWILLMCFFTYNKVAAAYLLNSKGERGLLHFGVLVQVGFCVSSTTMFILVNFTNVFMSSQQCQPY